MNKIQHTTVVLPTAEVASSLFFRSLLAGPSALGGAGQGIYAGPSALGGAGQGIYAGPSALGGAGQGIAYL